MCIVTLGQMVQIMTSELINKGSLKGNEKKGRMHGGSKKRPMSGSQGDWWMGSHIPERGLLLPWLWCSFDQMCHS